MATDRIRNKREQLDESLNELFKLVTNPKLRDLIVDIAWQMEEVGYEYESIIDEVKSQLESQQLDESNSDVFYSDWADEMERGA